MLAYLACPYTDPDPKVKDMRHAMANYVAFELIRQGIWVYSPLTHNLPIDQHGINGNWQTWKEFDHEMVSRCDRLIVLKLPGWEDSKGVAAEIAHAKALGKPIEWMEISEEKLQRVVLQPAPLRHLLDKMLKAYAEREWAKFHSPKNLVMNLSVEMGELMEHFRWLTEEQSFLQSPDTLNEVRDEIGDIFIVLLHLSHTLGIDPVQAAHDKLVKLAKKYPVDQCRGRSDKYTAYTHLKSTYG